MALPPIPSICGKPPRAQALHAEGPWIFPAANKSGHIEPWSVRGQHAKAWKAAKVEHFPIYTFRHTCLTRWAPFMDPWTLAYLAGHRDMTITKRYVHPQEHNTRTAMEKAGVALSGHNSEHSQILSTDWPIANLPLSN
jgi:integrase